MAVNLAALRMASTPASGRSDLSGAGPPPPGQYKVGLGALRQLSHQSAAPTGFNPHPTPVPKPTSGFMPALPEPVPIGRGSNTGLRSISPIRSPARGGGQTQGFPSAPPETNGMSVSQYEAVQAAQAEAAAMASPAAPLQQQDPPAEYASPKHAKGGHERISSDGAKREVLPATGFRALT